mmetsp:Transcript_50082/g.121347  ORF Transcript_50082/g.121347 Transcript_50082/m.121347 type:complete len:102 (-) Transcript_50082:112-417(-)
MGRAMNKAVTIAEILKRKLPLHQVNSLESVEMIDVFEPLEEGLDKVENKRYVSCMTITLITVTGAAKASTGAASTSSSPSLLIDDIKHHIGYQPPLMLEQS